MDFYSRLNYSLGNEDWQVEQQALTPSQGDHVVCVTASGDRPLHLLMTDCAKIMSLDMNPIQNYLLDLKLTAITRLDYEKYLAFLGCTPTSYRLNIFNHLKSYLPHAAREHWEQKPHMIAKGIIYQGRVERLSNLTRIFVNLLRHQKIKKLFTFTDLKEQQEYVSQHWDTFFWKKTFEIAINPKLSKYILRDPGLNSYTDYAKNPGQYIYEKMINYLNNHLANKSALLQLILKGKILPEAYFPYLTFEGFNKIRKNPDRLEHRTDNIVTFLKTQTSLKFDCFSMSDIASYLPQNIFEELLTGIHHSANPRARFCLREFMSNRFIPDNLTSLFNRNTQLEQKLEKEEVNFVYRFIVGQVNK